LWHISGSPDGRFAVGDDFSRSIYLIDRTNDEMILLSAGHKATAADHPHPPFRPDGPTGEDVLLCYYSSHEYPQPAGVGNNPTGIYLAHLKVRHEGPAAPVAPAAPAAK